MAGFLTFTVNVQNPCMSTGLIIDPTILSSNADTIVYVIDEEVATTHTETFDVTNSTGKITPNTTATCPDSFVFNVVKENNDDLDGVVFQYDPSTSEFSITTSDIDSAEYSDWIGTHNLTL